MRAQSNPMGTKSRDRLYGTSVRIAAERAAEARREADKLACEAWTKRMLAFKGPAQPSPTLGDALAAKGYPAVHPRVRGEHAARASCAPSSSGSSPRARRTHEEARRALAAARFIPACAENTSTMS